MAVVGKVGKGREMEEEGGTRVGVENEMMSRPRAVAAAPQVWSTQGVPRSRANEKKKEKEKEVCVLWMESTSHCCIRSHSRWATTASDGVQCLAESNG